MVANPSAKEGSGGAQQVIDNNPDVGSFWVKHLSCVCQRLQQPTLMAPVGHRTAGDPHP